MRPCPQVRNAGYRQTSTNSFWCLISEELVKFFVVHCECDEGHGDGWFAAGMPHMSTRQDFQKVFSSAIRMLDARAGVYDGVLTGIFERRNEQNIGVIQRVSQGESRERLQ